MKFDYADAVRAARDYAQHRDDAWDFVVEASKALSCGSKNCIIYLGDEEQAYDMRCSCLDDMRSAEKSFFSALLNYTKHNYEAIIPLAESKRKADERFRKLMMPGE